MLERFSSMRQTLVQLSEAKPNQTIHSKAKHIKAMHSSAVQCSAVQKTNY